MSGAVAEPVTHCPVPWAVDDTRRTKRGRVSALRIRSRFNDFLWVSVARMAFWETTTPPKDREVLTEADARANAEFLCRAVNAHDELVAACGAALVPLAILVIDEATNGPIREICPELRESVRAAHDAILAALAKATGSP